MLTDDIFQTGKNPLATSRWIPLGCGYLTASGAPSKHALATWAQKGVTDIITLQREDEMGAFIPSSCEALGIQWHHLPLSGRKLEQAQDLVSLARIPALIELFQEPLHPNQAPRKVVVHCAAGMHRTGLVTYMMLRTFGHTGEEAFSLVQHARPLTAEELRKQTAQNDILQDKAEALLESRFAASQAA